MVQGGPVVTYTDIHDIAMNVTSKTAGEDPDPGGISIMQFEQVIGAYIKNAIVVSPEGSELAGQFATFFENSYWEVKVFHDLDEANQWAGRELTA